MTDRPFTHHSFKQYLSEGQLMASQCNHCGALFIPPRQVCRDCHADNLSWNALSGKGTLAGFTIINIAPTAMLDAGYGRDNPYCTGIVALEEGPSISAQVTGVDVHHPETIELGIPLELALIVRGEGEDAETILAFNHQ